MTNTSPSSGMDVLLRLCNKVSILIFGIRICVRTFLWIQQKYNCTLQILDQYNFCKNIFEPSSARSEFNASSTSGSFPILLSSTPSIDYMSSTRVDYSRLAKASFNNQMRDSFNCVNIFWAVEILVLQKLTLSHQHYY